MAVPSVPDFRGVIDVSRETITRLEEYAALLSKWTKSINLISKTESYDIWSRHILDAAQLYKHRDVDGLTWCDLGAGGGVPGLVVAILSRELDPDLVVTLIESDQRKGAFLRQASITLDLATNVITSRIEDSPPVHASTVSARALAPLDRLLGYCARHAAKDAVMLLPKGRGVDQELTAARKFWKFDCTRIPSVTSPDGVILKIGALERV